MSDIVIRDARDDELDAISGLLLRSYAEYRPGPDASPARRAAFDEYFTNIGDVRSRLPFSTLMVAEREGSILGAVTFYPPSSSDPEDGELPPGWAGIRLLAVDPDARGQGIARLIMDAVLGRARSLGATALGLHTTELMTVARGMYERMGFTRVPDRDFYPTPDFCVTAYVLSL